MNLREVVTWRESVLQLLPELPNQFDTKELYGLVPALGQHYPNNRHIEQKLRQVLQRLRDEGLIQFSPGGGTYTKTGALRSTSLRWPFDLGQVSSRQALVDLFEHKGLAGIGRGMFRSKKGHPWHQHMVIFHAEDKNPYGDVIEEGKLVYIGEGQKENGDQQLVRNNRHLALHRQEGVHVHYFEQPKGQSGRIVYRGEVFLENFRYVFRPQEGRSVYEFILRRTPNENPLQALGEEIVDIEEDERPPGYEERKKVRVQQQRYWRDSAFRDLVLRAYQWECAVCGKPFVREPLIDLQAAHIVGVHELGRDAVQNGLALCLRHHWAFDNGFVSLTDDHRLLWLGPEKGDPHGEIRAGAKIRLPPNKREWPHPFYLDHHRRKWSAPSA